MVAGSFRLITPGAAFIAALWFLVTSATADEIITRDLDDFSVLHLESLPHEACDEVVRQTEQAFADVGRWLGQSAVWPGPAYERKTRVLIDPDTGTPAQMRSTIFLPESRLRSAHAAGELENIDLGIVHEVTHVLAASAYRRDRNRFYDDGLAVFLQQEFGPAGNYPANGESLHVAVARLAAEYGDLIPLSDADQARRESGDRRRLGYLQLGSFTGYLIERFGVDAYLQVYYGESLDSVIGRTIDELEKDWRQLIKSL